MRCSNTWPTHQQTYVYIPIEFVLFFQTNIHISQDYNKLLKVRPIHIELWLTWISLEFSLMNFMGIILSSAINTNSYMHQMQLTWRSSHVFLTWIQFMRGHLSHSILLYIIWNSCEIIFSLNTHSILKSVFDWNTMIQ